MGAKYLPTVKDRKANERFQQRKNPLFQPKKPAGQPPAVNKGGKKG